MTDRELFEIRTHLLQAYLEEQRLDGLLLSRADNFAMATGGKRNYVSIHTDMGANSLFVPREGCPCFVGNAIEVTRQMAEELGPLGCGSHVFPWYEGSAAEVVRQEFRGDLASDDGSIGANVHGALAPLRALLTETELEKYRVLGRLTAEAMTATLRTVERGMSEADIAARLVSEGAARHCHVPVALVAADERIRAFRHPLPTVAPLTAPGTGKCVEGYVMVAAGFLREGLVVSMTRFKRVSALPAGIAEAYARICAVDARMQMATRPGRTLGDVFGDARQAYVDLGFAPDEWHNHHQGGATGYAGRTAKGTPDASLTILPSRWRNTLESRLGAPAASLGMAFAWNPSAPGVKSEDTFLLTENGAAEIITSTPEFGYVDLEPLINQTVEVMKSAMA